MNWDQIESKWATMTRRVRADWTIARPDTLPKMPRLPVRGDVTQPLLADRSAAATARQKSGKE